MDKKKGNFREVMSTRALRTYAVHGRWDLINNYSTSTRWKRDSSSQRGT